MADSSTTKFAEASERKRCRLAIRENESTLFNHKDDVQFQNTARIYTKTLTISISRCQPVQSNRQTPAGKRDARILDESKIYRNKLTLI